MLSYHTVYFILFYYRYYFSLVLLIALSFDVLCGQLSCSALAFVGLDF